jgi:hypothetical protein
VSSAAVPQQLDVVHRNGMKETIRDGSYQMFDAQGRTIVRRRATPSDYKRLR